MEVLGADVFGPHQQVLTRKFLKELPRCQTTDVLIRVAYTELNPVDLQKLKGRQSGQACPIPPFVPGYGGSGFIEQVGAEVPSDSLSEGQTVAFLADPSRRGTYATHVTVDYRLVAPLPNEVSLQIAATVPLAGCTAYESLVKLGLGQKDLPGTGDTLLVVGGAGGVGSWAVSLAKAWHRSLKVIATASSTESKEWCTRQGATQVIGHDEIITLGGGPKGSVSHILCLTEPIPALFEALTEVIQPYGTICLVVSGPSIKNLDLGFCFFKAAHVVTETVFTSIRSKFTKIVPASEIADILELLSKGAVPAPLSPQCANHQLIHWNDALEERGLLDTLATGHSRGKLVMKIGSHDSSGSSSGVKRKTAE